MGAPSTAHGFLKSDSPKGDPAQPVRSSVRSTVSVTSFLPKPTYKSVVKLPNGTYLTNPDIYTRHFQRKILGHLEKMDTPSRYSLYGISNAFKRFDSIRGITDLLDVDLRSTYETITYTRCVGLLRSRGLEPADTWAIYCVFKSRLARGSICSNYILELILKRLDYRIAGLANAARLNYLRYVDNIRLYGDLTRINVTTLLGKLRRAIREEGFSLNESKTHVDYVSD